MTRTSCGGREESSGAHASGGVELDAQRDVGSGLELGKERSERLRVAHVLEVDEAPGAGPDGLAGQPQVGGPSGGNHDPSELTY
jgi:hypothetical protein